MTRREVTEATQCIAIVGAGAVGASIAADLICNGCDIMIINQWLTHIETRTYSTI